MSFSFRIQNFQSILDEIFEFKDLTSIIGPTDRGKSAVYRALLCIFYNEWEDDFLRRGAKKCILTLTFLNNQTPFSQIIQEKGKNINTYRFKFRDGRKDLVIPKAGVKIPDPLKELGFEIIETERKDRFNLNFQEQYDPLFLVAQSKPLVTSFFNHIFKITQYERALRKLTSDNIKKNQEYEVNEVKLKDNQEELAAKKQSLEKVSKDLESFKLLFDSYSKTEVEIKKYDGGVEKLNYLNILKIKTQEILKDYTLLENIKESLDKYSKYFKYCIELINKIFALKNVMDKRDSLQIEQNFLSLRSDELFKYLQALNSYRILIEKVNAFNNFRCQINYLNTQDYTLNKSSGVLEKYSNKIRELILWEDYFSTYQIKKSNIIKLEGVSGYLERLSKVLEPILVYKNEFEMLYTYSNRLKSLENSFNISKQVRENLLVQQNKLLDYEAFVNSVVAVCPLCKKPLHDEKC